MTKAMGLPYLPKKTAAVVVLQGTRQRYIPQSVYKRQGEIAAAFLIDCPKTDGYNKI